MDWHPIQGGVLCTAETKDRCRALGHLAHLQTLPLVNGRGGQLHYEYHVRAIYCIQHYLRYLHY